MEIYNENTTDLLNPEGSILKIHENQIFGENENAYFLCKDFTRSVVESVMAGINGNFYAIQCVCLRYQLRVCWSKQGLLLPIYRMIGRF